MIRRKTPNSPDQTPQTPTKKAGSYLEIPIPKFSSLAKGNYVPLLMVALLIASFLLGMLTTKVQYLEKNKTAGTTDTVAAQGAQPPAAPTIPQKVDATVGHLPIKGDKNAKITIIEFSDFQCPFCKQFVDTTYAQIVKEYVDTGKAKIAFRHFPLTSIHPNAQKAAEASECANDQGKFWEFHDELFKNQPTWSNQTADVAATTFTTYAGTVGIDTGAFASCVQSGKFAQAVNDDAADGQKAYVSGTPSFVINGNLIVGAVPYATFKQTLDQELNK